MLTVLRIYTLTEAMQRSITRFLLLVVLLGSFGPLALAAAAPAMHACCIRKAIHDCHDSSVSGRLAISGKSCCNTNYCRALTTARWAHAEQPSSASFAQDAEAYLGQPISISPATEIFAFHSSRAPPRSIA